MLVAKTLIGAARHEIHLDKIGRWSRITLPFNGSPAENRWMTRDDACAWFQLHGPQAALDSHFPGTKVLNVVPLGLPAPVIEGEVVAEAEVIPFQKQVAADGADGAALLAACQEIADAIPQDEIDAAFADVVAEAVAEVQTEPKPKRTRKPAAAAAPRSRRAKAA